MKLDDLRLFHLVVESQSFTRAAELADIPTTNVSRRIKALEQQLQVALLVRTTRTLRVTDAGRAFYQTSKQTLGQFDYAVDELRSNQQQRKGHLRLQMFSGADLVVHTLIQYQQQNPGITIELVNSERELDLIENNLDIGLRIGPQPDSSLIGRRIGRLSRVVVASPDYLHRNGRPQTVAELANHNCVLFRMPNGQLDNYWAVSPTETVQASGTMMVNDLSVFQQLLLQGHGIGFLPVIVANALVEKGLLTKLFAPNHHAGDEIWLVYPNATQRSPLVRHLIDYLLEQLAIDPLLQSLRFS